MVNVANSHCFLSLLHLLPKVRTLTYYILTLLVFSTTSLLAQPVNDVCATATEITFNGSTGCKSGSLQNADDDLTNFPGGPDCNNPNTGNEVWYVFTATNVNTEIRLTAQGFNQAHVNVFKGDCSNLFLVTCAESNTGEAEINVGSAVGEVFYISVSDGFKNQGNFNICVESNNAVNSPGNICSEAVTVCTKEKIEIANTDNISTSATTPSCFVQSGTPSAVKRDSWFKFTVTKSGNLEFAIFPKDNLQEIDWALYDITNSCPGSELSCNFNYSRGMNITSPTGMWTDPSVFPNPAEFNNPIPVVKGRTYALVIDNYFGRPDGFDLFWSGSFDLSTTANFIADEVFDCGPFTAQMEDKSIGATSYLWSFPDGSTSNAQNPSLSFTTPGEQLVELQISNNINNCTSSFSSRFIINPLAIQNNTPAASLCLGDDLTFTHTADTLVLGSPADFKFRGNNTFDNSNPLNLTGTVRNIFPRNYISGNLQSVCFSLRHQNLKELEVNLVSPSGTRLQLIGENDLIGQVIENVCFSSNASASITTAATPYKGNFIPKNNFDAFIGDIKEGFWTLEVRDVVNNTGIGFFNDWSLTFFNENKTTFSWTPSIYLTDDSILNPTLESPNSLVQDEIIYYDINATDLTTCTDLTVSEVQLYVASVAGADSSLYFCEDVSNFDLFDKLSPYATLDGKWYDDSYNLVSNFFDPSSFLGQTVVRWYKILGANANCGEDSAKFTLTVRPDSSIQYNFPQKLCDGENFEVDANSNLTGFTTIYGSYTSRDSTIILNKFPNTFQLNTGQLPFRIDSILFDKDRCTLPVNTVINPTLVGQPKLTLDSTVCNDISTSYIAYLTVTGGETSTLEVNGQNASSRSVVSAPIASGSSFLFECSDANFCNIDSLTVNIKCNCLSHAGTIQNQLDNSICDNDTLTIVHNQDQLEDPDDISEYIITNAPFPNFGGIVTRAFYSPEIEIYLAPPYVLGQTYYITLTTGSKDLNQRVDLQDPCLAYTRSIKFTFTESPEGSVFLGLNSVCKNGSIPVNFRLTKGQPSFSYYRDGQLIYTSSTYNGSFNFTFSNDTVFYVDSIVSSNGCVGYDFKKDSSRVDVVEFPDFENVIFTCDNVAENYQVSFDVVGGDANSLNVNSSITLNNTGRAYTSDFVPSNTNFNITVDDKNLCQTSVLDSAFACPCISSAPAISTLPNQGTYCESDSLFFTFVDANSDGAPDNKILDGNDTLSILIVNSISDTALRPIPFVAFGSKQKFAASDFNFNQTYYVFAVVGNNNSNNRVNENDKCIAYSAAHSFTIVENPNIFTTGTDTLCMGEALQFSVNNSSLFSADITIRNSASAENFTLSVPPGFSQQSIIPSVVGSHTYYLDPVITDSSPAGCVGTWLGDSLKAVVLQSPSIQFTNLTDTICAGETFTIEYTLITDVLTQFDLSFNGNPLTTIKATDGNSTFSFMPTENGVVTASNLFAITGTKQCFGTVLNSLPLAIFEPAQLDFTITPSTPCVGDAVNIDVFANKNNYDLTYTSPNNNSTTANGPNAAISYATTSIRDSIYFEILKSKDVSTQSLLSCNYNIDSTLYIDSKPIPTINITPLFTNPICENDTAFFEFSAQGSPTFEISVDIDGSIKTINSGTPNFNDFIKVGNQAISYTVTKIEDAFCSAILNNNFTITPISAAIASVSLQATNLCEPALLNMVNTTTNLSNCEWSDNNNIFKSNDCSGFSEEVLASNGVSYKFSYTDENGCRNTVITNSVNVLKSPVANFDFSPTKPNITSPSVQTRNLSTDYTFSQWFINSNLISQEDNPSLDFPPQVNVPFDIMLLVKNTNGCTDTISYTLYLEPNLSVYFPSAFTPDNDGMNDCFEVKSAGASNDGYTLQIFNRWGEIVFESNDLDACWDGTYKGENLPLGMYTIKLRIYTSTLSSFEEHFGRVYIIR